MLFKRKLKEEINKTNKQRSHAVAPSLGGLIEESDRDLLRVMKNLMEDLKLFVAKRLEYERPKCDRHTTVGGGVSEDILVPGMSTSDVVMAMIVQQGASPVSIDGIVSAQGKFTVTFSADPSNDHILNYEVTRCNSLK
jgi:hypothetical protein